MAVGGGSSDVTMRTGGLRECTVSHYIGNPLLLGGLKFDLRIYVVVSSLQPLRVHLCREGLARFATEAYSLSALHQRCGHLTNYSLNKHSKHFVDTEEEGAGSKWTLSAFKARLQAELGEARACEVRMWRPRVVI